MVPKIDLIKVLTAAAPIVATLLNKSNMSENNGENATTNLIEKQTKEERPASNNYYINITNNYYMTPDDRIRETPSEISRKALEVLSSDSHYDV